MKSIVFLRLNVLFSSIFIFALINQSPCFGQSKIRVGIYDSRAVMLAYFNSGYNKTFMQTLNEFNKEMQKATQEKDSTEIKKLNFEGPTRQAMLHEKVFGTGSVRSEIMEIKGQIDSLAKEEKIDLVVSKWELNYVNPNFEIVDLTVKITSLFKPNQRFENILKELLKTEPIKDAYLIKD